MTKQEQERFANLLDEFDALERKPERSPDDLQRMRDIYNDLKAWWCSHPDEWTHNLISGIGNVLKNGPDIFGAD